jgi:hypothetical protein
MSAMATDPRAAVEYRIPAVDLRPGDLVNTSPGEDDWQEVLAVHTSASGIGDQALKALATEVAGRYVVVRLTDLAPLDSGVFFEGGQAMSFGGDSQAEQPVADLVSPDPGERVYLYTKYELVTIRATSA